jgi:hypothetical protein
LQNFSINRESHNAVTHPSLIQRKRIIYIVSIPISFLVNTKMGYSKTFLLFGLVFAVVLLISSNVSARELGEAAQTYEFSTS